MFVDEEVLFSWNVMLAKYGVAIRKQRELAVEKINKFFNLEYTIEELEEFKLECEELLELYDKYFVSDTLIKVMDKCLEKIYDKVKELDGTLMIIADHGNCELMIDENDNIIKERMKIGEICVSGICLSIGYINHDNSSFYHDSKGQRFYKTGDLGYWEKEGIIQFEIPECN